MILAFHHAKFSESLLDVMNNFIIETFGDMPAQSIERYSLYFHTGAFYNMTIKWLENDCLESAEEMSKTYLRLSGVVV